MAESNYYVGFLITNNGDLTMRIAAAAQQESESTGKAIGDPAGWAQLRRWDWGTQSDWVEAVQSALQVGITAWGQAPTVITDQMILSWVQPAVAATPEPEQPL